MIYASAGDALGYIRRYLETQAERAGPRKASTARTTLQDTIEWLVQRYELQLESRGVRMRIRTPAKKCHGVMDGLVLRQVAESLVSNRSVESREGRECVSTCRSGWAPEQSK